MKIKVTLRIFDFTRMNITTALTTVTLSILLVIGSLTANAQDVIYVTKSGIPDPDGSASKPYHVVESGIARTLTSSATTVKIGPGKYYETFTVGTPVTLEANGGVVTIGKLDYQASTMLEIITVNIHIAGDTIMPSWADCLRAGGIADFIKALVTKPDLVAFQELWDDDFFKGGDCDGLEEILNGQRPVEILRDSEYPYGRHGKRVFAGLGLGNSGLAIMSEYPLSGWKQKEWTREGGDRAMAKGFIRSTITKDGFSIGLFNLHTKAEDDIMDHNIRWQQLRQLVRAVNNYRDNHPDHVVFVMGDFNIKGESCEYYESLIGWMASANGKDADRNSPGFIVDSNHRDHRKQWTSDDSNLLSFYFDSVENGRLDYIFYIPSLDGSIEVLPTGVDVLPFRGQDYLVCTSRIIDPLGAPWCVVPYTYRVTNESSDHWSVRGQFKLIRK